jgi:hypothetical protein
MGSQDIGDYRATFPIMLMGNQIAQSGRCQLSAWQERHPRRVGDSTAPDTSGKAGSAIAATFSGIQVSA